MTGARPPGNMSLDDKYGPVGGLLWDPEGDFVQLNIKELNFQKKSQR